MATDECYKSSQHLAHLLVPYDSLQLSTWQQRSNTVNSNKVNLEQQHTAHGSMESVLAGPR
jgi:hypothetical protein